MAKTEFEKMQVKAFLLNVRQSLWRESQSCALCGKTLRRQRNAWPARVHSPQDTGPDGPQNFVVSCRECVREKGRNALQDWERRLTRQLENVRRLLGSAESAPNELPTDLRQQVIQLQEIVDALHGKC
ncbi:MAG: hypothetical protein KF861_20245 [Planctomycetaceae bacterium]|nr:hypothetical protein [Planctomycetaceae bacterium]